MPGRPPRPSSLHSAAPFQVRAEYWLAGVLVLALVLTPLVVGWATTSCEDEERADYPELEQLANEVMAVVDANTSRVGSCEDTGQASASVAAGVSAWSSREQAHKYFMARGWTPVDDRRQTLLSPDGRYEAHYILVSDDNVLTGFEVRFTVAR